MHLLQDTPTTRSTTLPSQLLSLLAQRGQDINSVLGGTGVFAQDLDSSETHITARSLQRLLRNASRRWRSPDLSFELGRLLAMQPGEFSDLFPLVCTQTHTSDQGQVITIHAAYQKSVENTWMEVIATFASHRAAAAKDKSTRTSSASALTSTTDLEFYFNHDKPEHAEQYEVFVGAPCHFNSGMNAVLARSTLPQLALNSAQTPLLTRVRQHVHDAGRPSLTEMANQEGLALATFKRILYAHGTTFQDILDESMRHKALIKMLLNHRSPNEVCSELGYTTSRSFRRSFQRWTGTTPTQFIQEYST